MMLVIVTSPILSVCILISTAERYHGSNVAAANLLENGERRVSERIAAYAL
jgi:hypothetical protein